jgi:hypothetical protein
MRMTTVLQVALGSALVALAAATPVQAQAYLAPSVGSAFGGDTQGHARLSYGGILTFAGESHALGFAVDFGYQPDFFPGADLRDNNVTTLMGNLVLISGGHTRVYASVGLGLLKTRVSDAHDFFDIDSNELGLNAGGGILVVPSHLGLQADVRYFRNLTDPERDAHFDVDLGSFDYWRATAGLVFRF